MEQIHDYDDACTRYLLGELSEQEQALLEESYFADDALFERFLAVKDDLIDAYARGDLAGQRRERFEHHFLATDPRRQRVSEAKEFIRAITPNSTNAAAASAADFGQGSDTRWRQFISKTFALRPLVWQAALAVLLLVMLAGSWALVRRFKNQRAERQQLQNEEARRQQEEERARAVMPPTVNFNVNKPPAGSNVSPAPDRAYQASTTNKRSPQPLQAQVASLLLLPFSSRDGSGSNSLRLRPDTRAVRLRLAFTGEVYSHYDVVLRTVGGEQMLHRSALKARSTGAGKSVTLTLDPSIFGRQDYIIRLSGLTAGGKLEAVGDYYFRVERSTPQSTPTATPQ